MEAMREQFVSDVSHELKNPISMIIGYAEGERMNTLVEELLDLSSYRAGSIRLEKEKIQLGNLITKSIDKYTMIQNEKKISVVLDIDDNIWNSFYQMDTDKNGSGIGLAITRSIVQLHNYKIEVFVDNGMNHFCIFF